MSNQKDHANEIVLPFLFLDLLVFPRLLGLFGIPLSLLFVIKILFSKPISKKFIQIWFLILVIGCFSVYTGYLDKKNFWLDDFKRVLQICSSLLYGFNIFQLTETASKRISIVLRVFFCWLLSFAVVYLYSNGLYVRLIGFIYPEAEFSLDDNVSAGRFAFHFTDPNSLGYLVVFATFVFYRIEKNARWLLFGLMVSIFAIAITQSRGAIISLGIAVFGMMFDCHVGFRKGVSIIGVIAILIVCIGLIFKAPIEQVLYSFEQRQELENAIGEGLGAGRIGKYEYFFANINLYPFGTGYYQMKDGIEFRPHSDLIRINLAYGLPFLLPTMFFLYPRRMLNIIYFLVMLVPFLVNTLIDDYRLLPLYLISIKVLDSQVESYGANGGVHRIKA